MPSDTPAVWYTYLTPWQQELVATSETLLVLFESVDSAGASQLPTDSPVPSLPDYGCVVFPMAKAFEGFLKKYFLDLGLITPELYNSKKFRIGRAFNPDIQSAQKNDFWIYDDVARVCQPQVARALWEAWLVGRNQIFHYFPDEKGKLSLAAARRRIEIMSEAMTDAVLCPAMAERGLTQPQGSLAAAVAQLTPLPPLSHSPAYRDRFS